MSTAGCLLLSVPPEIRLHIYSFLLNDGNQKWLQIRNKPPFSTPPSPTPPQIAAPFHAPRQDNDNDKPAVVPASPPPRRSSTTYHVMERTSMFHRRCHKTTYHLHQPDPAVPAMDVAILAVCRTTYHEGTELLYGRHGFDFDTHIEAVVPFLQDRTPYAATMLRSLSVYKRGPMPCLGVASEKHEWSYLCRFLASASINNRHHRQDDGDGLKSAGGAHHNVKRLRLVVECGRPSQAWEGIQELSESDLRLLSLVGGHTEVLEWIAELAKVKGLETLEVVPDSKYLPQPKSPAMALYAALSASVEHALAPFLRSEMGIVAG